MIKILKKVALSFGFDIRRLQDKKPILFNVFHSDFSKRVLISYLKDPFVSGIDLTHTNKTECYTAAEIFNELGFRVDVINLFSTSTITFEDYDVIYGQGTVLERSFYCEKQIIRIFYATGCNPFFSDIETVKKIRQFFIRTKILSPNSGRLANFTTTLSAFLADKVIILGNNFVLETFTRFDNLVERYTNLNAFFFDIYQIDLNKKDFFKAKKHFIWFGSSGLLHKGLDVVIEIFKKQEDIILHICGADIKYENKVMDYYKEILQNSENIINHGFVNLASEVFRNLMDICAFVIFPSVSEGGAPALLNVVANGGLIPIVTKSSGVDLDEFGWIIEKCDYESFRDAIIEALELDENTLKQKSEKILFEVRKKYTLKMYKENLKQILMECLDNHDSLWQNKITY